MVLKNEKKKRFEQLVAHDSLHTHLKPNYYSMYGND
jgi:hypothetical protein